MKKEVKLLEQTKILLVDTVLGVWIFYNSSGRYHTATGINCSILFFQMQQVKVLRREDFKEVQIHFHATNKIPNHSVARKEIERSQGKPKESV
jgi:hypothetical protein